MNHLKTNPVGIDLVIDQIQKKIYDPLLTKWSSLDIYPRVYSNLRVNSEGAEEFVLEHYTGNGEYQPVLGSDTNKIFFLASQEATVSYMSATSDLFLVCILDVGATQATVHRGDEEAHMDVMSELVKAVPSSDIERLLYGIENFRGVTNEAFDNSNFKYSDIHPKHVFVIRMSATFNLIENNC